MDTIQDTQYCSSLSNYSLLLFSDTLNPTLTLLLCCPPSFAKAVPISFPETNRRWFKRLLPVHVIRFTTIQVCVLFHFFSFAVALAHYEYSTGRAIAHKPTNYSHFLTTSEPYSAVYSFPWEPYFIADKKYLPRYDARFAGYGNDKAVQTYEMNLRGFKFVVMPDAFVIHIEHEAGPWRYINFHSCMFAVNGYCGFDTSWVLVRFILRLTIRLQTRSWHGQETTDGYDDEHIFQ